MTALLTPPPRQLPRSHDDWSETGEARVLLDDVLWDTYVALRDAEANNAVRMTYDEGRLELVSPSRLQERYGRLLGRLVIVWTEELSLPIDDSGSATFRSELLRKGLEADGCFFVENEPLVRGKREINLSVDPPPDLALEIDLTSPSLSKLPVYAAIRVPEVWQWRQGRIRVLLLTEDGSYVEANDSRCLPGFPFDEANRILADMFEVDSHTLVARFREWIRTHRPENGTNGAAPDATTE